MDLNLDCDKWLKVREVKSKVVLLKRDNEICERSIAVYRMDIDECNNNISKFLDFHQLYTI